MSGELYLMFKDVLMYKMYPYILENIYLYYYDR